MKTIAVVFVLCFAASALAKLTEERRAQLYAFRDACIAETGVDPVVVTNAKNGQIATDDVKLPCFISCFFKKVGIMKDDGSINQEVVRAKLIPPTFSKDEADKLVAKCTGYTGANDCEVASKVFACLSEQKIFQLI